MPGRRCFSPDRLQKAGVFLSQMTTSLPLFSLERRFPAPNAGRAGGMASKRRSKFAEHCHLRQKTIDSLWTGGYSGWTRHGGCHLRQKNRPGTESDCRREAWGSQLSGLPPRRFPVLLATALPLRADATFLVGLAVAMGFRWGRVCVSENFGSASKKSSVRE